MLKPTLVISAVYMAIVGIALMAVPLQFGADRPWQRRFR